MLTNALNILVYELFLETYILWKNNKTINFPIVFYIFYESGVKNFHNMVY